MNIIKLMNMEVKKKKILELLFKYFITLLILIFVLFKKKYFL